MQVMEANSPYHARLAGLPADAGHGWLAGLREGASAHFAAVGFPTRRDEDWKYTGLKALEKTAFAAAAAEAARAIRPEALEPWRFGGVDCCHLVFVDGRFAAALSGREGLPAAAVAGSLAEAIASGDARVREHLGRHARSEATPFVALNTALMVDGAHVRIPRGVSVDPVIHLLFVSTVTDRPTDSHPRNLIVLEESARATVVEDYLALEDGTYFTNPVTEIALEENAELEHHTLVRQSDRAFHIGYLGAVVARAGRLTSHAVSMGGRLVRNNLHVDLDGEGIECTLNGLVVGSGEQHIDNQTRIAHLRPSCESHELYKAILDDRAEGVFHGKIYVAKDAQKTDAKQSNHALLLTRDAEMNSKPELEIYADDVKCTHGATVGQLDRDALFYLRSRGVDKVDAENLLTFAFASDVVQRIRLAPVRREVERMLYAKLPQAKRIRE